MLGHEKLSMRYDIYSLGLDMKGLRRVVEKITHPGLDLTHFYVGEAVNSKGRKTRCASTNF